MIGALHGQGLFITMETTNKSINFEKNKPCLVLLNEVYMPPKRTSLYIDNEWALNDN